MTRPAASSPPSSFAAAAKKTAEVIRSRIVGFDPAVAPDQLLAHPENHRRHPAAQQAALRGSLKDLGWVDVVKVNVRTQHVFDGHARVEEALRQNATVPVLYVDLSEDEERLALAVHDQITGMAVHDQGALDSLLKAVVASNVATDDAVKQMLAGMASPGVLEPGLAPDADEDAVPEPPKEPVTKLGDRIVLGQHVLVCGDSKDPAAWEALLGAERADLVWTDPPYGVSLEAKVAANPRLARPNGPSHIENDDLNEEDLEVFLRDVFALVFAFTRAGGVWYVASPSNTPMIAFAKVLYDLDVWHSSIIWAKDRFVLGRADYHSQHEFIFYGWKPGAAHRALEDRTQGNVWQIERPQKNADHPTMKPVALVERALNNSSVMGEIVVDPFGGSGTTLIACEKTGRRARLIEISPVYCDVICRRWAEATGGTPQRFSADGTPVEAEEQAEETEGVA